MEQDLIDTNTAPVRRWRPTGYRLHLPHVDLNRVGAGLVTGTAAGALIGGIGARLAMRVVALLGEGAPSFSIGGTLGILMMGAVLGAIGGLGFALVRWLLRLRAKRQVPISAWRSSEVGHVLVVLWRYIRTVHVDRSLS